MVPWLGFKVHPIWDDFPGYSCEAVDRLAGPRVAVVVKSNDSRLW